jgi:hypothetical protein
MFMYLSSGSKGEGRNDTDISEVTGKSSPSTVDTWILIYPFLMPLKRAITEFTDAVFGLYLNALLWNCLCCC